jgi:transposase
LEEIQFKEAEVDRLLIIKQVKNRILTQQEASERLGISIRQIRRIMTRVQNEGAIGVKSKHKGGNRLFSKDFKECVLKTLRERYQGFGPTFASEKLNQIEGLKVSKETLRTWMISSGLWNGRSRKRARIHQSRERRPCFGELVQIDGSHHDWFEGRGPKCCLLVFIDDASSKLIGLLFDEAETTLGYMTLVEKHVKTYGRPLAYYSDKHSIFKVTREATLDSRVYDTQFHRALRELSIELICAQSSQAKGRVERANKTLQDRLVKELRLRGISNIKEANAYGPEFIEGYNQRFGVIPSSTQNAHRALHSDSAQLKQILSTRTHRRLSKNLEFSLDGKVYQIITATTGYRLRHAQVTICEHTDGTESVILNNQPLAFRVIELNQQVKTVDTKELNTIVDQLAKENADLPTEFLTPNQFGCRAIA